MAYLGLVFYGKLKQTQIKTMYHVIVKIYKLNTYKIHMCVYPYVCICESSVGFKFAYNGLVIIFMSCIYCKNNYRGNLFLMLRVIANADM